MKKIIIISMLFFVFSNKTYSMADIQYKPNVPQQQNLDILNIMENLLVKIFQQESQKYLICLNQILFILNDQLKNQDFLNHILLDSLDRDFLYLAAFLIKKGADTKIQDASGKSALEIIIEKGYRETIYNLFETGFFN